MAFQLNNAKNALDTSKVFPEDELAKAQEQQEVQEQTYCSLQELKTDLEKKKEKAEKKQLILTFIDQKLKETEATSDTFSKLEHLKGTVENINEEELEKKDITHILKQLEDILPAGKEEKLGIAENLEQEIENVIQQIREKLEAHRYSKRLANPICNFLTDKFVHRKKMGKIVWRLVGLVAGAFGFKKLFDAVEKGGIDQVSSAVDDLKENAPEFTQQQVDKVKKQMKSHFEEKLGRNIDENTFTSVFNAWREERGHQFSSSIHESGEKFQAASVEGADQSFNIVDETFGTITIPVKAMIDLACKLTEAGVTSWSDLSIDFVVLPTGKAVVQAWLRSLGLFANGMSVLWGSLSLEEYTEYIKSHVSKMNVSSREAMWAILYRQGGPFWKLAGQLGTLVGEGMSLAFMNKTWGDVGKLLAYWKGGVMQNYEKELQVFKQLEDALKGTGVFDSIDKKAFWGATHLETLMKTAKENAKIFSIAHNAGDLATLERQLVDQWFGNIVDALKEEPAWENKDLKWIKTKTGNKILSRMGAACEDAADGLGKFRNVVAWKLKLPWMKTPFETQLIEQLRGYAKVQETLLQKTDFLHPLKKITQTFEKGKQLGKFVDYSDGVKLSLKNVTEAKDFFDNVKTIGRSSPELLKTLFKGFPLVMLGKEMFDKFINPDNTDSTTKILQDGFLYLTPLIWPLVLVREGVDYKNGEFRSPASVGIGAGMFCIDGFFAGKALKVGGFKAFGKYMISPVTDAIEFWKSSARWAYTALKMTRDGVNVVKNEWIRSFLKGLWRTGRSVGGKMALMGLLAYFGYRWVSSLVEDAEEQHKLAKMEKMSSGELEAYLKKEWPHLNDTDKEDFIKLATAHRMGIVDLDSIDVKKENNHISVTIRRLVNGYDLEQTKYDMQMVLDTLEGSHGTTISYQLDGGEEKVWEIKEQLLGYKKYFFDAQGHFHAQGFLEYLMTMWYSKEDALKMIKTAGVVTDATYNELKRWNVA